MMKYVNQTNVAANMRLGLVLSIRKGRKCPGNTQSLNPGRYSAVFHAPRPRNRGLLHYQHYCFAGLSVGGLGGVILLGFGGGTGAMAVKSLGGLLISRGVAEAAG